MDVVLLIKPLASGNVLLAHQYNILIAPFRLTVKSSDLEAKEMVIVTETIII